MDIEVRDEGIFFKRLNGQGLVPWSHVTKWRASEQLILLYPTTNLFYMIPRHLFETSSDYLALQDLLRSHVGAAT